MRSRKRMYARRRADRWLTAVAATLVVLGACAPETADWSPVEAHDKNRVDWVAFHHTVRFPAGEVTLDSASKAALSRFVRRLGNGDGVRVMVAASTVRNGAALAGRRETAVTAYLRELGVRSRPAPAAYGRGGAESTVTVTLGRYVVTPPSCPNWSKPSHLDYDNRTSSNFGCATEANLGAMVADPSTLVYGAPVGPADGEAQAKSIEDYRKGEAEAPPPVTSLTISSGGGDGGGK